ncbi:21127_t:CDS:2, partial [Racocetra persica]
GIEHEDLRPYISNIITVIPAFEQLIEQEDKVIEKEKKKNPRIDIKIFKWIKKRVFKPKNQEHIQNYNLPLAISICITSYVSKQVRNKIVGSSAAKILFINLNILVDSLSGCERILRTPIPLAYAVHITQTVWLYCITLSFQLVSTLHYTTIPIVFIASIILFGIEAIGEEIENPFGYDYNDLDLDEVEQITKYPRPKAEDWDHETNSMIDLKEKILSNSYSSNIFDMVLDITATHDDLEIDQ